MADIKLLSTIGVEIKVNNTQIVKATSFGDIGGEPDQLDATCLTDTVRVYINGVQDFGSWQVDYVYNDTDGASVEAAETASKTAPVALEVKLPNGDSYSNTAEVSGMIVGAGVNEVLMGRITCALQGNWTKATNP